MNIHFYDPLPFLLSFGISLFAVAVPLGVLSYLLFTRGKKGGHIALTGTILAVFLPLVGGLIMAVAQEAAQEASIVEQADTVYGVTVQSDRVEELAYPPYQPDEDEVIYGTTTVKVDGGYMQVALVWADDEMTLVQLSDAGPGTELPRR